MIKDNFIFPGDKKQFIEAVRQALYASKICSYAQGFALMAEAQKEYNWKLNFGEIAQIWRGGCIIRSALLDGMQQAYLESPHLPNLMLDDRFSLTVEGGSTWPAAEAFFAAVPVLRRMPPAVAAALIVVSAVISWSTSMARESVPLSLARIFTASVMIRFTSRTTGAFSSSSSGVVEASVAVKSMLMQSHHDSSPSVTSAPAAATTCVTAIGRS